MQEGELYFQSNINNYFERQSETNYSEMEYRCLKSDDYREMEKYIIERAKEFNNDVLVLNDAPLIFEDENRKNL